MIPSFHFHSATSLVFGRGVALQVGEHATARGAKRVFVITDATLVKVGLVEPIVASLKSAGLHVEVCDTITPEPPVEVIVQAEHAARKAKPDLLVAIGGGSNMDAAKLVAVLLAHGGTPADWVGDSRVPGPVFPLFCLPTTAGTGSEVSAAAVFTDTAKQIKVSTLSNYLRPALALVDPALTDRCPKQVSADSGIDALTHAIEAFTAVSQTEFARRGGGTTVYQGKNPLADAMARQCLQLGKQYLRRAVYQPTDTEARDGMALCATLGGLAFSNAGVALVHAMEYPVGGAVHVSHGAGNGLLLPFIMKYNRSANPSAFAELDAMFDGDVIAAMEQLRVDIDIPTQLRQLGVTEAMLPTFAEKAFAIKRLMRVNPRYPTGADELLEIYREAW
jgi:alcohol dehydrogenase